VKGSGALLQMGLALTQKTGMVSRAAIVSNQYKDRFWQQVRMEILRERLIIRYWMLTYITACLNAEAKLDRKPPDLGRELAAFGGGCEKAGMR
jgi:hypothetical protein